MAQHPSDSEPTDPWAGYRLTPMLRQYVAAKADHPDALLMFRMGDFFEMFFDDARVAARELDLTLTSRDKTAKPIPMAGVPHHAIEGYIAKLVARGYTVALCDQVEDAKLAVGLVRRAVTRVITPGTISDLAALEPSRASYLAAAVPVQMAHGQDTPRAGHAGWAVAFLDLLAGELLCTAGDEAGALDELRRLGAREVLAEPQILSALTQALRPEGVSVRDAGVAQHGRASAASSGSAAGKVGAQPIAAVDSAWQAHPTGEGEGDEVLALPPVQADWASAEQRAAMGQACALVARYAARTQRQTLTHLAAPRSYARESYLVMDAATRASLELTAVPHAPRGQGSLMAHLDRTRTAPGARLLHHWLLLPLRDLTRIAQRADAVAAFKDARGGRERLQAALAPIRDMERLAGRVALGRANPRDVRALGQSLASLPAVAACVAQVATAKPSLAALACLWREADLLQPLGAILAAGIADEPPVARDEGGIFAKGYRPELDALIELSTDSQAYITRFEAAQRQRTGISGLKVRYNRVFGYYIEVSRAKEHEVPDDYVRRQTLANAERYVTHELKAFEVQVLEADGRRRALESTLFAELLADIHAVQPALRALVRLVAQTDALAALAEVADKHRYVRPLMVSQATLELTAARHPVLEVMLPGGEPFVPNDLSMDAQGRALLLVTGPNMAGKSTLMRQVALCTVMAQMGGFVPATRATLGVVDRLFTRVGAGDNLTQGHSTFMVEMMETAAILASATSQSLVLLDEIGRGTSTFDGLSIAWAVAEHLHDVARCRTLFATHYHELTAITQTHPRCVAVQVSAQEQEGRVVFLRQLQEGAASRSYGIEVARLAQMPETVLSRARGILATLEATPKVPTAPGDSDHGPRARSISSAQLGLFASGGPDAGSPPQKPVLPAAVTQVVDALAATAINDLTPMQALALVHGWQQQLAGVQAQVGGHTTRAKQRRR